LLQPGFSLTRHLCLFGALVAPALVTGGWLARRARLADLWIVPAYVVVANLVEYLMHRFLMHRPLWPRRFYEGHTLGHHRAFRHDSMEIDSWRELNLVMMPWFSVALFFAATAPLAAAAGWAFGRGAAGLFLLAALVTFVTYEGVHALYHFPARALERLGLGRSRVFRFLHRAHRHHHRLVRMRWVNFNISLPLADLLLGTLEDEAAWQVEHARRVEARAAAAKAAGGAGEEAREREKQRAGADPEAA
jgi:hypothetical protein